MTTQIRTLPALHHVETPTLVVRLAQAIRTVAVEIIATVKLAADSRNAMRRMADEFEHTRPEHAARLRKLANASWID